MKCACPCVGLCAAGVALLAGAGVWAFAGERAHADSTRNVLAVQNITPVAAQRDDDNDGEENETIITLADLPQAVRAALAGVTTDDTVTQVSSEGSGNGTKYDVEYTKGGAQWAVEFSAAGAVLENELDDDGEDQDD